MLNILQRLLEYFFGHRTTPAPKPVPQPKKPAPSAKTTTKIVGGSIAAAIALAIPFVAAFEGYSGHAYRDSVGVLTICYGQTAADGANFNKVYTEAECRQMLGKDLVRYNAMVDACVKVPLPAHRRAALISFVYNLGQGQLCGGPVARYLNAGNVVAGCNAMLAYNHAGGRVLAGLTRRRQLERAWCLRTD